MKKQEDRLIRDLRKKIDQVDKDKHRVEGKLEAAWKTLCNELGKEYSQDEITEKAEQLLIKLRKKYKKAEKERTRLFGEIKEKAEQLGI